MCNLYRDAIRRVSKLSTGNLTNFPGIFPNKDAPVVRGNGDGGELPFILNRKGEVIGASKIARDISDKRRAEHPGSFGAHHHPGGAMNLSPARRPTEVLQFPICNNAIAPPSPALPKPS